MTPTPAVRLAECPNIPGHETHAPPCGFDYALPRAHSHAVYGCGQAICPLYEIERLNNELRTALARVAELERLQAVSLNNGEHWMAQRDAVIKERDAALAKVEFYESTEPTVGALMERAASVEARLRTETVLFDQARAEAASSEEQLRKELLAHDACKAEADRLRAALQKHHNELHHSWIKNGLCFFCLEPVALSAPAPAKEPAAEEAGGDCKGVCSGGPPGTSTHDCELHPAPGASACQHGLTFRMPPAGAIGVPHHLVTRTETYWEKCDAPPSPPKEPCPFTSLPRDCKIRKFHTASNACGNCGWVGENAAYHAGDEYPLCPASKKGAE